MASLGALGRALSTRNARIYFTASSLAWTGLWMHRIAVSWLAWELTGSAFWVGMVAFCDLAPAVIASPLAGAVADRVDRVRLAMVCQAAIAVQALLVALLAGSGMITIGILLVLEVIGGTASSFAQPARQTLMPGIVARSDLPAAVACNSLTFNVARFLGPALAAPLIAAFGVVPAILCNALGYGIACLSLMMLTIAPEERRGHPASGSLLAEMLEGITYAARHHGLGPVLAYAALTSLLLRGVQEILPPFVERAFGRGAESLAVLTAAFGVGALLAGLWVASRGHIRGTTRLAVFGGLAQAAATAAFAATSYFPLGLVAAALIGGTASIQGIAVQTLIQHATHATLRGRALALWGLITRAFPALGALCLGAAGEVFGLRLPTLTAVVLFLLVFAWGLSWMRRAEGILETETRN